MLDAYQRFLGVDALADAATLLDVDPFNLTQVRIESALRERLARVYQHPEGRSEEAEQVRQSLRNAAEELKQSINLPFSPSPTAAVQLPPSPSRSLSMARTSRRQPAEPPLFNLTAFDRMVLAVLVGYGGWNARSRDRLVALASSYGVSVQGLMRVVQGLGSYARAGGPPLDVHEIASARLIPQTPSSPGTPVGPALLDRLAENLGDELRRGDPWPTIKLSIIFGLATLIAAIISLRILLNSDKAAQSLVQQTAVNSNTVPKPPVVPATQSSPADKQRLAQFPKQPTFLGNALPVEAVNAADQCSQLPAQFDDAARKLSIADEPSEAIYRNWEQSILTISTGWVLADASSRSAIDKAMFEALRAAADAPTVSDRLLAMLVPPPAATQPLDVWRGAWLAGTLGKISSADSLPPVVAQRARILLETALSQSLRDQVSFELAAGIWLDRIVPQLVSAIGFEPHTYDYWELWISAQRALGRGERHDRAVMSAVTTILATDTDLSRPGPAVDVLGRLLSIGMENRSLVMKQSLQEMFDSPKITARDLWVLTSLMATSNEARWFPANMVLPDEADERHRGRIRDDLEKIWPRAAAVAGGAAAESTATGRGISVDPLLGERWAAALEKIQHQLSDRKPESLMRQLIMISRLIEAADAIANQNHQQAENALDEVDGGLQPVAPPAAAQAPPPANPSLPVPTARSRRGAGSPVGGQPALRTGQPIGRDGEFAAAYQQVGKNTEQRLELLRALRTNAGTDLGPIDAELVVREAYRGSPQDVRATAQSLIPQQFITGPIIAMEMLDQFADGGANDAVSEMIQALTGAILPPARAAEWAIEARHALVRHALSLRPDGDSEIDDLAGALIDSYTKRAASLKREPVSIATPRTPQAAAELLVQAWMDKAALAIVSSPVPDDFAGLQRRHMTRLRLAEGPIQTMAANQLAILDLLTYVTVAEQPSARSAALEILHQSSEARSRLGSVLEQSVEVERAIAQMWRIRMGLNGQPKATGNQRTSS